MPTNYEKRFGDLDRVARQFIAGNLGTDGWSRCVRANYIGCNDCRFKNCDCNSLDKYDVSVEWLQEEFDD